MLTSIKNRINKARAAFFRQKTVWSNRITKMKLMPKLCFVHPSIRLRTLTYDRTRPQIPTYAT